MNDEPLGENGLTDDDVKTIVKDALSWLKARGIYTAVIVAHVDNVTTDYAIVDQMGSHFLCRGLAGHAYDYLRAVPPIDEDEDGDE